MTSPLAIIEPGSQRTTGECDCSGPIHRSGRSQYSGFLYNTHHKQKHYRAHSGSDNRPNQPDGGQAEGVEQKTTDNGAENTEYPISNQTQSDLYCNKSKRNIGL